MQTIERTRLTCVAILLGGILLNAIYAHFAFDPKERFTQPLTYVWLVGMAAVPISLYFLKGARAWRIGVLAIWSAWVSSLAYAARTM